MRYGDLVLHARVSSMVITLISQREIWHYPGTNDSEVNDLGRQATNIRCDLIARGEAERRQLMQLMHGEQKEEFELETASELYKRVILGPQGEITEIKKGVWALHVEFIALDPTPYDLVTREAIY